LQWTLTLKPSDDLAAVKEALRARLLASPGILSEPAPQLFVQEWSDDKRILAVQAWTATENSQSVQQETLEVLGTCLNEVRTAAANESGSA
jgi:small-conductance mechanosensitive channel